MEEPTVSLNSAKLEEPTALVKPGAIISGRYHVIRCIATGGMGAVYEAHDYALDGKVVALKVMTYIDDVAMRRFQKEYLVGANLTHPNIVQTYERSTTESGQHFITMEYMGGGTLTSRIAGGPLPLEDIAYIMCAIARGVAHLHDNNIIHRDLKPENVLFDHKGEPKVTDFGLVRTAEGNDKLTQVGETHGSAPYMPPEQFVYSHVDKRADIYSLGIIGFEMATGKTPFWLPDSDKGLPFQARFEKLARMHAEVPLPNVAPKDSGLPKWLDTIIGTCAAKNRNDRYDDMKEVIAAFEKRMARRVNAGWAKSLPLYKRAFLRLMGEI